MSNTWYHNGKIYAAERSNSTDDLYEQHPEYAISIDEDAGYGIIVVIPVNSFYCASVMDWVLRMHPMHKELVSQGSYERQMPTAESYDFSAIRGILRTCEPVDELSKEEIWQCWKEAIGNLKNADPLHKEVCGRIYLFKTNDVSSLSIWDKYRGTTSFVPSIISPEDPDKVSVFGRDQGLITVALSVLKHTSDMLIEGLVATTQQHKTTYMMYDITTNALYEGEKP